MDDVCHDVETHYLLQPFQGNHYDNKVTKKQEAWPDIGANGLCGHCFTWCFWMWKNLIRQPKCQKKYLISTDFTETCKKLENQQSISDVELSGFVLLIFPSTYGSSPHAKKSYNGWLRKKRNEFPFTWNTSIHHN